MATQHQPHWRLILWLGLGSLITFVAALMTGPLHFLRARILQWFRSDLRSFVTSVFSGFLVILFLVHVTLVANTLLLLSAMSLARLDLQTHEFDEWHAFWILIALCFLGLALGSVLWNTLYWGKVSLVTRGILGL
jgi:hypothetical protein